MADLSKQIINDGKYIRDTIRDLELSPRGKEPTNSSPRDPRDTEPPEIETPQMEQVGARVHNMTKEEESEIKNWLANGDPKIAAHAKMEDEDDLKCPGYSHSMTRCRRSPSR
eukprot:14735284-Heterocapsa_arctica.AAC.1